ncbi:hypothetical protein SNE40_014322 [Patella caerulea]|uniref:Uncharacterized protein n=1 Tax=Patella caerulea TaxID=87958 RepID=A0AAN8PSU1_PATCE
MARDNHGQIGFINHKRRLQIGISSHTSLLRSKAHYYGCGKFKTYKTRNFFSFTKKRHRDCFREREKCRFLQYAFLGSQKERGVETGHQPTTLKRVSQENSFQNGYTAESFEFSRIKRLGNLDRFKRCLSPYSHFPRSQEISSFLCRKQGVPIQSAMFRPNFGASCLSQNSVGCSRKSSHSKHQNGVLLGRPFICRQPEGAPFNKSRKDNRSSDSTRFYNQSKKSHNLHHPNKLFI